MSISNLHLCLIFLTLLTFQPVFSSRSIKLPLFAATAAGEKLRKEQQTAPASLVSETTEIQTLKAEDASSSSMTRIKPETNSAMANFFRYRFPFQGWPFHKFSPVPMVKPFFPSVPATGSSGTEDESQKLPSSSTPSKGNRNGGNA